MKPLLLTLEAFASFPSRVTVDFEALGRSGMLLIHGPTGAGKTTLMDGICYALYGVTSGGERQSHHLRSRQAPGDRPTTAQLRFQVGEAVYRATRSPEWQRPVKRGQGTTREPQRARLERAGRDGTWTTVADRWKETTTAVEELLGMGADPFRQVVILPQGRFRRLLSAPSVEREAILQRLLETDRFGVLENALVRRARELMAAARTLDAELQVLLGQEEAADSDALKRKLDAARTDHRATRDRSRRAGTVLERRRSALERGREDRERQERHRRARERLASLLARQEAVAALARAVDRAEQAERLQRPLERAEEAARRQAELAAAQAEAEAAVQDLQPRLAAAQAAVEADRADTGPEKELRATQARLEQQVATAAGLAELTGELAAAERVRARQEAQLARGRALLDLAEARTRQEEFARLRAEVDAAASDLAASRLALAAAEREVADGRRRLAALDRSRREARLADLAADLEAGSPCPVCGSTEHPDPAHPASPAGATSTDRDLPGAVEALEARVRDLHATVADQRSRVDRTGAVLWRLLGRGESPPATPDQTLLIAHGEALDRRLAAAERALSAARPGGEEPASLSGEAMTEDALERLEAALTATRQRVAELGGRVVEAQGDRTGDPPDLDQLNRELAGTRTALIALESHRTAHRRTLEEVRVALAGREERLALHRAERPAVEQAAADRAAEFAEACAAAGFADADRVRAAALSPEALASHRGEVSRWEKERHAAEEAVRQTEADTASDRPLPDLARLEAAVARAAVRLERARRREGQGKERCGQLSRLLAQVEERSAALAVAEKRARSAGRVAEAAAGKYGREGLSFQRWVLAALLEEVVQAAGLRLHLMSRGRYRFERSRERDKGRRVGGLELNVWDAWTGAARPVATLSGGEGFLAALSLALGLTEVVQARSGGRRMEALFIDEGFGSLDAEALDAALAALEDLREGARLVAVISHVPELRERLPVRLEVTRRADGSGLVAHPG